MFIGRVLSIPRALVLLIPFLLASFGEDEDPAGPATTVSVTLANHEPSQTASGPVDIMESNDTCYTSCSVTPGGGFRSITLALHRGEVREFDARRNGAQLDFVFCKWNGETVIMVDWDGSGLKCVNWQENE